MSWKYYKKLFENGGADENKFILGIDLGSSSSAIAFFNTVTEEPELIDLSGGYGKPSMPSVVQYIPETREWVFGEYALLNKGVWGDYTFFNLIDKIGKKEYVEIGNKTVSAVWLLSKYIKELIESCKSINPSCEIAGIVCAVPTYAAEETSEELRSSFRGAGLEKQLIGFISARESVLTHINYRFGKEEKIIMQIDYGARKMRGSIERLTGRGAEPDADPDGTNVVTESYYEDVCLGFDHIEEEIADLFTDIYCAEKLMDRRSLTEHEINQLYIFTHQNKSQMFKINQNNRPSKLYFNFAFPPFVKELSNETKLEFINKLELKIEGFIKELFKNSSTELTGDDIERVICYGGGFESPFAREYIEKRFPKGAVTLLKNGKAILAEGACVHAAKKLGLYRGQDFYIQDNALLKKDIGVKVRYGEGVRFFPIAERNTFWWRERKGVVFTLSKSTDTKTELSFYLRENSGEEITLCDIPLEGLEKRPKGATRLKISLNFEAFGQLNLSVEDFGFGEMYPKTGFKQEVTLKLAEI